MSGIKDLPAHKRPREKLIEAGPENLKDKELIAILLRTGREGRSALDLAQNLLSHHPLEHLLSITHNELKQIKGIGSDKATSILAALEIGKRALHRFDSTLPTIQSPQDAVNQLADLPKLQKEHFVVLYLNARNQVIHKETISVGTINASLVHPREVFAPAIKHLASGLILAHNHPSGDTTPSEEDKRITQKLISGGELLGLDILDHLILTKTGFLSFKEKGLL